MKNLSPQEHAGALNGQLRLLLMLGMTKELRDGFGPELKKALADSYPAYEALIAEQEHWTRRMLEFIGLPWDPRCLDFHRTDRVVITASRWQVRQTINARSVGRWRNYEKFLGPLLQELGDITG